jgi:hypothetical protein
VKLFCGHLLSGYFTRSRNKENFKGKVVVVPSISEGMVETLGSQGIVKLITPAAVLISEFEL